MYTYYVYLVAYTTEITWVYTPDADLPREAFFAGENENCDEMFIGRTVVDGDMIPGMIVPNTGQLIFSNKGVITTTDEKQVEKHIKMCKKCFKTKIFLYC